MTFALVVLAGAIGAVARYAVDGAVQYRYSGILPLGTLVVNVAGSVLLGLLVGLRMHHGFTDSYAAVLGIGFCGAFTTFSTFSYETVRLVEDGAHVAALVNVLTSAAGALAAAGLGLLFAAALA